MGRFRVIFLVEFDGQLSTPRVSRALASTGYAPSPSGFHVFAARLRAKRTRRLWLCPVSQPPSSCLLLQLQLHRGPSSTHITEVNKGKLQIPTRHCRTTATGVKRRWWWILQEGGERAPRAALIRRRQTTPYQAVSMHRLRQGAGRWTALVLLCVLRCLHQVRGKTVRQRPMPGAGESRTPVR